MGVGEREGREGKMGRGTEGVECRYQAISWYHHMLSLTIAKDLVVRGVPGGGVGE
jgi:hypothetical protein